MAIKDCFKKHGFKNLQTQLEERVAAGEDMFDVARELALGEYKRIHTEINSIRNSAKQKSIPYSEPSKPNIEEIQKEYDEKIKAVQQKAEAEKQKASEPPPPEIPPTETAEDEEGEGEKKKKGILNRLFSAEKTTKQQKENLKEEGLTYKPKSQKEAQELAKSIVAEFGAEKAAMYAKEGEFDDDVNSAVFAESLNALAEQEESAKTVEEKNKLGKAWAKVAIDWDMEARKRGQFNAYVGYFYKTSPIGVVIKENADRKEEFGYFAKGKEKSWEEAFNELMKEPEFEKLFKEKVYEQLKKERAESRKKRIEKTRAVFRNAKAKFSKSGAMYSSVIPPQIITAALDVMEKAYEAGEAVVKVIQDGIDYINKEFGTNWDSEKFRQEWEEKLAEKAPLTEEEIKQKTLDKFRKKLTGLSDKQKDEVVKKMFEKVVEAGALEYEDLRNIIAETLGYGKLSAEEAARLQELVKKRNAVGEAAKKVLEEKTEKSLIDYNKAQLESAKAGRDLQELLWNKPDILKRLTSIMQLSTLGIPALVNNPIYNFFNQLGVRFPVFLINDTVDRVAGWVARKMGKEYEQEYNVWNTQKEFFEKLGFGAKEAFTQIATGLNRADYTQKELYGQQIRPFRAMKDLLAYKSGKKKLTSAQYWDRVLQATVGIPAEAVARVLNLGDKPQRFAAEGAASATFAKSLGLKGIDYKIFVEFPKEMAYEAYKQKGLSDSEASQKAEYIAQAIIKEGQRSTFQQDNLLNDMITGAFAKIGGKDSGGAAFTKALVISPYIKIPTNAFWSFYNLLNPEVAVVQAAYHAAKSKAFSSKDDYVNSRMQKREARYWMAHAMLGMATRAVVLALVQSGVFIPGNTGDESKKERQAETFFSKPGSVNITKLWALLRGQDPSKIDGGVLVSNRWFGQFGTLGNSISRKWEDATPEQRENQQAFWNTVLGGMELEGLQELQNGVFANTSAILEIVNQNGSLALDRYLMGSVNLFANILQPASIAQITRTSLDEVPSATGDTFLEKLNQNFAQRSALYRKVFDVQIKRKRSIWGEPIPKGGNTLSRMFGISKIDPKKEGTPLYEDYLKTGDTGFLPPAVPSILDGQKLTTKQIDRLEELVGQNRKALVLPYVSDQAIVEGYEVLYSKLPLEERKKVLDYLYQYGRVKGVEQFVTDFPQFEKVLEEENEDLKEAFNEFKKSIKEKE